MPITSLRETGPGRYGAGVAASSLIDGGPRVQQGGAAANIRKTGQALISPTHAKRQSIAARFA
jgi:hypothetical protein